MNENEILRDLETMTLFATAKKHNITPGKAYTIFRKHQGPTAKLPFSRLGKDVIREIHKSPVKRNLEIVKQRNQGVTYTDLGKKYNCSRQRIQQIYKDYKNSP